MKFELKEGYCAPRVNPFDEAGTCKIAVCEPSTGLVDAIVYDNRKDFWVESTRLTYRSNARLFNWGTHRLHTSYARETLADNAINAGMDLILFIDDDMIVPKHMLERLLVTMSDTNADMVAPLCTQRVHPFKPVIYKVGADPKVAKDGTKYRDFKCDMVSDYEPDSVFEVQAIGFGVVLLKVDVLKRMKPPFFFSNASIGEDIWFCFRAVEEAKAKIMVDSRIKIGHMSIPHMVTELDFVIENGLQEKFSKLYGHLFPQKDRPDIETHNQEAVTK